MATSCEFKSHPGYEFLFDKMSFVSDKHIET